MQDARERHGATPTLDRRIAALRRSLVVKVWLHGCGTVLGVAVAWLAFAYLADWALRVPHAVRIVHGFIFPIITGYFLWRDLVRPLRAIPERAGLALLIERGTPELCELLISAVEFQDRELTTESPALVQSVLEEAERAAASVSPADSVDGRPPRNRFLLGAAMAALLSTGFVLNPEQASIFLNRLLGGTRPWPQRTHLSLEIPDLGAGAVIEIDGETIDPTNWPGALRGEELRLRIARGTDVPLLVRVEGVEPESVTVHFEGGRDLELQAAGAGIFRTLLRSLQEDVSFYVTGGDDRDGLPRAEIAVLQPPDIEGLTMIVTPPAYSGLAETRFHNRDIEVLAGSQVRVHVLPFPANATGDVRFFPERPGGPLALTAMPFPMAEGGERSGLFFEIVPQHSLGFHIELADASGLENPDPGLFRIGILEDRSPELRVLSPARTDFEIVLGGSIPLRVRAEDDFGIVAVSYEVRAVTQDGAELLIATGQLEPRPIVIDDGDTTTRSRVLVLGSSRMEVIEFEHADLPVAIDQRYELVFTASDTHAPEANEGRSHPLHARVVSPEELLRRMQDRLGQARLAAVRLTDLQREKRRRVEELLGAFEGDGSGSAESGALAAALSGQRRVQGDALSLARELAVVAEDVLYARLDPKAGPLLEFYDVRQRELTDLRYHAGPMRELAAALASGDLSTSGFATNLVQLAELSLVVSEDHTERAVAALEIAEKSLDRGAIQDALVRALEEQLLAEDRLEDLLQELSVWDNFQNVLALTRDILNRQKALRQRTQQFASEK